MVAAVNPALPAGVDAPIARALSPDDWRPLMARIRREAAALAREGRIDILRKGKPVDPEAEIRGVIRLRTR